MDGFTPDCPGCLAARRRSTVARNHTDACRNWYRNIVAQTEKGKRRITASDARMQVSEPNSVAADVPMSGNAPQRENSESVRLPQSEVQDIPLPPHLRPAESDPYEMVLDGSVGDEGMDLGLLAQIAIEYIKFGKHVAEVFSPPRVTKIATKIGLRSGFALDLTEVDSIDGKPWGFNCPEKRARAEQLADEQQQFLLVGCPPCRPLSCLFGCNASRMSSEVRKSIIK